MKLKKVTRRHFLKTTGSTAATIPFLYLLTSCRAKIQKPNIIFFIADDMRPEMFNCLEEGRGRNLTPHIDNLADEGTVMMAQHVSSPLCTPSRYNCLTGRYASRAQNKMFVDQTEQEEGQTVIRWNSFITEQDITLPKILQKAGYITGMVGKNHLIEVKDLHSFPSYNSNAKDPEIDKIVKENYQKTKEAISRCGFDYVAGVYHNNPNFIGLKELAVQNLDWITQGGVNFIDQNKNRPFFLYFATTVPHSPVEAERSWNANPLITANGYLEKEPDVQPKRPTIPERLKEAGITEDGKENVLWLDDALGALINKLKEHAVYDNTIIFFFNDHGQNAKGTIYQGGVLDPGIIWKKNGFKCGEICNIPVSNIDFAPTILDYAGYDYKDITFDGKSFRPALEAKKDRIHESLYFELGYVRGVIKDNWKYIALRYPQFAQKMSMKEREKILDEYNQDRISRSMNIVNLDPSKPFSHLEVIPGGGDAESESTGKYPGYYDPDQLYDLQRDPEEQINLAGKPGYKAKLNELKTELKKYLKDLPGTFAL